MTLLQCILIALWAGFCSYDDQGPQMLRRPLLVGPVVGIILGNVTIALMVSATLELTWMGLGNMAGYQTPDMIVGTIIGITFAISSGDITGEGIATGIALATAVAVLSQQLMLLATVIRQFFAPWADKVALTGDFDGLMKINIVSVLFQFAIRAIPTFLVVYYGEGIINDLLATIPTDVLSGINKASGVLPAVGLSILMTIVMKKGMWAFLIFGFVLNAYLNLNILSVTLISLAFGTIYTWIMEIKDSVSSTKSADSVSEKEGYDL